MRLLVISLFCICLISLFIIILSLVSPLKPVRDIEKQTNYTAQMYFNPKSISTTCGTASHSAAIMITTNSESLQSAQIELSYNPGIFYNITISPSVQNILGIENTVDINEVRQEYGRASFIISSKSLENNTESTAVATLSFNTYPQTASTTAAIKFLNKSSVLNTSSRSSILTETLPLTVSCN